MSASGPSGPLVYLNHGLVRVCEIGLSYMGKYNGNPDLVCKKSKFFMFKIIIIFIFISLNIYFGCSKQPSH